MESLAFIVIFLFLIAVLAGPLSIALSSQALKSRLDSQASLSIVILNLIRKAIHLILVAFGNLVGVQFIFIAGLPLLPRAVGLFSVVTCYIALRREYFPEFFFFKELRAKLGITRRSNSAPKSGKTSGNDGHGPEGQH
jgi:signal transduction histidine kinase